MRSAFRQLLEQRAQPLSPVSRNTILGASTVGILAASIWAWRSSNLQVSDLNWKPIVILLVVAAPLSLLLKAAEFALAARIAGQRPPLSQLLEIAVVSSAANLLPLPGSPLVTVRSISEGGSSYGTALAASAVPGFTWLGVTGVGGGIAIVIVGPLVLGAVVIALGIGALTATLILFRSTAPAAGRLALVVSIVAVESGWLAVSALRLGLAVTALGVHIDPAQALALSVAGALTVAIGFLPGGLGLREALIAGLSPLIGLSFDTGVLLGSLDRVVWLFFLTIAGAILATRRRIRPRI